MSHERSFGSLRTASIGTLAARLADAILDYAILRAVTVDPQGRVWLECAATAAETDMVGVYSRSLGVLELTRALRDDLVFMRAELGELPARRVVVSKRRVAA